MTLTVHEYLTQHAKIEDVPASVKVNAEQLIPKINALLASAPFMNGCELRSGYRPPAFNAKVPNAAPNSKHMTGDAVDVADNDGILDDWLTDEILEKFGLYREHPSQTKSWCHLQQTPPGSKKRTFYA